MHFPQFVQLMVFVTLTALRSSSYTVRVAVFRTELGFEVKGFFISASSLNLQSVSMLHLEAEIDASDARRCGRIPDDVTGSVLSTRELG